MKKHFSGIVLILFLGMFSWGQGTKEYFDIKKSREEREILREILLTKLSRLSQNSEMPFDNYLPNISSFYLPGEGMVFVISGFERPATGRPNIPNASPNSLEELDLKQMMLNNELLSRTKQLIYARNQSFGNALPQLLHKNGQGTRAGSGIGTGTVEASDKSGATAPVSPVSNAPPNKSSAESMASLEKSIEELNAKIKATNQEIETVRSQKLTKAREAICPIFIETIANFGDSLTTVKPEEHINFVLNMENVSPKSRFVISARKSWVVDYKAGRLTLDAFKQKVIQYSD
jgi:hypothetical protein